MRTATVKTSRTWNTRWKIGEALWNRDHNGVWCLLLTREPDIGPRGGLRGPGEMAEITGPTLASVNRALVALGFSPTTSLRLRDIAAA